MSLIPAFNQTELSLVDRLWSLYWGPVMRTVNIHAAKTHLSRLLNAVANGEEILIARAGRHRGASGAGEPAGSEEQHAPILRRTGTIQMHQRQLVTR
jgi:hypothetical protein